MNPGTRTKILLAESLLAQARATGLRKRTNLIEILLDVCYAENLLSTWRRPAQQDQRLGRGMVRWLWVVVAEEKVNDLSCLAGWARRGVTACFH
jgi:hypothetical protein